MGIDPVTSIVGLGFVTASALALYIAECEREKEQRRRQEEESRRWASEKRKRERDAKRREKEREQRERREEIEREEEFQRELLRMRNESLERIRRQEAEERRRLNSDSLQVNPFQTSSEYYRSRPYFRDYEFERDYLYSPFRSYYQEENRNCKCSCRLEPSPPRDENTFFSFHSPFSREKGSVTVTFKPPQTTQNKNQGAKNQSSGNQPSSSNNKGASTSGNASKTNTNASTGSQQSQRNNNNNNNNSNNNKKNTVQDYGELNDFIKILKSILDRCNVSEQLRAKILSFFNNFKKHEKNFLRLLEDFTLQNIAIEDILSIVIRLFQTEYFAQDVAYENFIALLEFVAKYIKDELISEMAEDSIRGNKKPFDIQRKECMKKVLQRNNILTEITALFEKARKEIIEDNASKPLVPDFSGIFTKVYHYFKHKVVKGKEWTVKEYFDWIRKQLVSLRNLSPEYVELTNVDHPRREIVFEMYSTVYGGYFRLVVRAYGPVVYICSFYFRDKRDKKAKDGDPYVDGKKKT